MLNIINNNKYYMIKLYITSYYNLFIIYVYKFPRCTGGAIRYYRGQSANMNSDTSIYVLKIID